MILFAMFSGRICNLKNTPGYLPFTGEVFLFEILVVMPTEMCYNPENDKKTMENGKWTSV